MYIYSICLSWAFQSVASLLEATRSRMLRNLDNVPAYATSQEAAFPVIPARWRGAERDRYQYARMKRSPSDNSPGSRVGRMLLAA